MIDPQDSFAPVQTTRWCTNRECNRMEGDRGVIEDLEVGRGRGTTWEPLRVVTRAPGPCSPRVGAAGSMGHVRVRPWLDLNAATERRSHSKEAPR
jgi:hypothetical protein